jgi:hypothetical protein
MTGRFDSKGPKCKDSSEEGQAVGGRRERRGLRAPPLPVGDVWILIWGRSAAPRELAERRYRDICWPLHRPSPRSRT